MSAITEIIGQELMDTPSPEQRELDQALENKRESLAVLTVIGGTKEYLGVDMSLGDNHKLPPKDVEKYFVRYQNVIGSKKTGCLLDSFIKVGSQLVSRVLPIDNREELANDLQNCDLIKTELSKFAGKLALHGSVLVAFAAAMLTVAKNIKLRAFNDATEQPNTVLGNTLAHTESAFE